MQIESLKDYYQFKSFWDYYQTLPMQSLEVTALLGKNFIPSVDGSLHLDSLLAYVVTLDMGEAVPPLDKTRPRVIPSPLQIAWMSSDGLPLFVTTSLRPTQPNERGTEYWHKRFPTNEVIQYCKNPNTPTTRGPFKEYRIPMQAITSNVATAYCIGNAEEIRRLLLTYAHFIGKKPSQGKGAVLDWQVTPINTQTYATILKQRAIPAMVTGKSTGAIGAWTPPYWYRPWHLPLIKETKP
jgi:hypothetical protein